MSKMCDEAYFVIRSSLILTCVMLALCLLVLLIAGKFSASTYELHRFAKELFTLPQAILLIAAIASVIMEEYFTRD